jgi:hypothetical protein
MNISYFLIFMAQPIFAMLGSDPWLLNNAPPFAATVIETIFCST